MKITFLNRDLARVLAALALVLCATELHAQAFDGDDDTKMYLGYTRVGNLNGLELGYEEGINDFFSYGTKVTFLSHKQEDKDNEFEFYDYSDLSFYLNYHFMELLKLPDNFDIYLGPVVSLKTASLQTGVRFNFGEIFGLYAGAQYNFFETFAPRKMSGVFPKNFALSGGITISF